MNPYIITVTGPSGSGKTALASKLSQLYGPERLQMLRADCYYRDQSDHPIEQREMLNYDHPDAFEFDLLTQHLNALKNKRSVEVPQYDFKTHTRTKQTFTVESAPIILVEGILLLSHEPIRAIGDCHVFINTPIDICLLRRIRRDCIERARNTESVLKQYEHTVRPMLIEHILPTAQFAHQSLPDGGWNPTALEWMCETIDQSCQHIISS